MGNKLDRLLIIKKVIRYIIAVKKAFKKPVVTLYSYFSLKQLFQIIKYATFTYFIY